MTDDRSETIETMRKRYLHEYKSIHKKSDRIAFFKEIGEMAEAANALAWKKFADAMLACLQDDMETALALFEEAITLDPQFAYPWNGKGNVLRGQKRYDEALAAYEKAITLEPEDADFHHNLGVLFWRRERPRDAAQAFRRAVELGLESPQKEAAESFLERAEPMIASEEAGKSSEDRNAEDRSSDDALISDLAEAMKDDLPAIQKKKAEFKEQMADSVAKERIFSEANPGDVLVVLRDCNRSGRGLRDPALPERIVHCRCRRSDYHPLPSGPHVRRRVTGRSELPVQPRQGIQAASTQQRFPSTSLLRVLLRVHQV